MKNGFFIPVEKLNKWYIVTAGGFVLYLAACAVVGQKIAGVVALVFALIAVRLFLSASAARSEDKERVGYNLLWGSGAMALLLGACTVVSVKLWLGL